MRVARRRPIPAAIPYCLALAIVGCLAARIASAEEIAPGETPGTIVIELDRAERPLVRKLPSGQPPLSGASRGVCIWNEQGQDRWQSLGLAKPAIANREAGLPSGALDDASRAGGETPEPSLAVAMLTAQLDPLVEPEITRAAGLLTPPGGPLLDGRITLRRRPQTDGAKYPKTTLHLQSGETTARISLEQGQSRVPFPQIAPQLPPAWRQGLPPGQYTLQAEAGLESVTFSVEEEAARRQATRQLDQLRQARLNSGDPLYVQVAVEEFMNHKDSRNRDRPYLADALDVLENLPDHEQTPYLRRQRQQVLWRLGAGGKPAAEAPGADSVGIGALDRVRELILRGMWSQAQSDLGGLMRSADGRTRALASLYQAVVVAEAGLGSEYADPAGRHGRDADAGFRQTLQDLEQGSASDRLRAHQDYANFLLRQAQDRLHSHAFQMAAGVEHPLFTAMLSWDEAQRQYEAARELASTPEDRAAIDVSLARLYALLAEIVATIDARGGDAALAAISRPALRQGLEYASRALAEETASPVGSSTNGSFIIAMAREMKAQLAFRLGDWKTCREQAEAAQTLYGQMGALVGEESIHRLLGLYYLRAKDLPANPQGDFSSRQMALEHFLVAHVLSEVLRQRFPA